MKEYILLDSIKDKDLYMAKFLERLFELKLDCCSTYCFQLSAIPVNASLEFFDNFLLHY